VIDRGDGPKIEGTRITVYAVLDYLRAGRTRNWIAAMLNVSSEQVQAAMDYFRDHNIQVHTDYERIMSRIQQGHSDEAEARLQAANECSCNGSSLTTTYKVIRPYLSDVD
jgi:uncharacterized protein (DUF433 family)